MKWKNTVWLPYMLTVLLAFSGCAAKREAFIWESGDETDTGLEVETQAQESIAEVVVDVSGAVEHPGVYRLFEGARVCDAVNMAGGLKADADVDALNQAAFVNDAEKIRVYTREETAAAGAGTSPAADGKVNINTADIAQLCELSGIGESRARDIIAYREMNGSFQTIEEIMNVSGIKEATFNKIKNEIAVG